MLAVKLLFCISLIIGSRADGFDFNNPNGFLISVVDQNNKGLYHSRSSMKNFGWTPRTDYVTVTASDGGNEIFKKDFRTSLNGNGPMCNYALLVSDSGYAHYRSSLSSRGCNEDENTSEYHDLVAFDNASDRPFNPSFRKDGEEFAPDDIHGWSKPGSIRIYTVDDVYLSSPAVNIDSGDVVSTAADDPYISYMTCTENKPFLGQVIVTYSNDHNGDYKCEVRPVSGSTDESTWKENKLYDAGDVVVYGGETWKAKFMSYGYPPSNGLWDKLSGSKNQVALEKQVGQDEELPFCGCAVEKRYTGWLRAERVCEFVNKNGVKNCAPERACGNPKGTVCKIDKTNMKSLKAVNRALKDALKAALN